MLLAPRQDISGAIREFPAAALEEVYTFAAECTFLLLCDRVQEYRQTTAIGTARIAAIKEACQENKIPLLPTNTDTIMTLEPIEKRSGLLRLYATPFYFKIPILPTNEDWKKEWRNMILPLVPIMHSFNVSLRDICYDFKLGNVYICAQDKLRTHATLDFIERGAEDQYWACWYVGFGLPSACYRTEAGAA